MWITVCEPNVVDNFGYVVRIFVSSMQRNGQNARIGPQHISNRVINVSLRALSWKAEDLPAIFCLFGIAI